MASKLILVTLYLAAVIATVSARPRFLAVPLEDIQFINGLPQIIPHAQNLIVRRSPQQPLPHQDHETAASGSYPSGGSDSVDYGAYTGSYGAFGWYSDHPVGNHGSY